MPRENSMCLRLKTAQELTRRRQFVSQSWIVERKILISMGEQKSLSIFGVLSRFILLLVSSKNRSQANARVSPTSLRVH